MDEDKVGAVQHAVEVQVGVVKPGVEFRIGRLEGRQGGLAPVAQEVVEAPAGGRLPALDVVARPGAQEEYFRKGNPDGKSRREIFGEPMRAIPAFREPAPRVETDTLASVGGDPKLLDTRVPPSDMHKQSLKDVIGKRPVALLFSTPQLCQSRVCGPVTDIAYQLEHTYGKQIAFIHQEVYKDNDPNKGLRTPLQQFNLKSEPWLFVVGADGKVTERLEGSFGLKTFENAVKTAL